MFLDDCAVSAGGGDEASSRRISQRRPKRRRPDRRVLNDPSRGQTRRSSSTDRRPQKSQATALFVGPRPGGELMRAKRGERISLRALGSAIVVSRGSNRQVSFIVLPKETDEYLLSLTACGRA